MGLQCVEQRIGKAEGQMRLTMRCTYLSWATPPYVCMRVWLRDVYAADRDAD